MSRLRFTAALSLALTLSTQAFAGYAGSPAVPPSFRGDMAFVLGYVEKQTVSLEQAIPQSKFAWRPGKGVRSVSEVYLHIAEGLYILLGKMGHEAPADVSALMQSKKWESQTTNKEEIKKVLVAAYAFAQKALAESSDADLEKIVDIHGTQMSERAVWIGFASHCSQHLGQSIAYARTNGVVPPWNKPGGQE